MSELESKAFLGIGLRFPMEPAVDGELALAAFEQDIREAIRIILGTAQGERVMRPDFGAGLQCACVRTAQHGHDRARQTSSRGSADHVGAAHRQHQRRSDRRSISRGDCSSTCTTAFARPTRSTTWSIPSICSKVRRRETRRSARSRRARRCRTVRRAPGAPAGLCAGTDTCGERAGARLVADLRAIHAGGDVAPEPDAR